MENYYFQCFLGTNQFLKSDDVILTKYINYNWNSWHILFPFWGQTIIGIYVENETNDSAQVGVSCKEQKMVIVGVPDA